MNQWARNRMASMKTIARTGQAFKQESPCFNDYMNREAYADISLAWKGRHLHLTQNPAYALSHDGKHSFCCRIEFEIQTARRQGRRISGRALARVHSSDRIYR